MRTPRSRLSKGFSLEKRLIDCEQALELYPGVWRGKWNKSGVTAHPTIVSFLILDAVKANTRLHAQNCILILFLLG